MVLWLKLAVAGWVDGPGPANAPDVPVLGVAALTDLCAPAERYAGAADFLPVGSRCWSLCGASLSGLPDSRRTQPLISG